MIKIIIIENQKLLRDLISDTLSENGFEVISTSADAKDSISLCEKHSPDIVLMDICTENNSSGIYYGGIIKQQFPQIKVVLMTRGLDISFVDNSKKAKIDSFIYKNIGKDSLVNTLKNTIIRLFYISR